jgi:hypothetical protein
LVQTKVNAAHFGMITAIVGPQIVEPRVWTLVFARDAASWWSSLIACGRHKHVRCYAYVPFLHVWVFFDPAFSGTTITLASNAEAVRLIAAWTVNADLVAVTRVPRDIGRPALFGFCVPAVRRLTGIPSRALRPSRFYRDCLAHGGTPLPEIARHGRRSEVSAAPA